MWSSVLARRCGFHCRPNSHLPLQICSSITWLCSEIPEVFSHPPRLMYLASIVICCSLYLVAQLLRQVTNRCSSISYLLLAGLTGGGSLWMVYEHKCWMCWRLGAWSIEARAWICFK